MAKPKSKTRTQGSKARPRKAEATLRSTASAERKLSDVRKLPTSVFDLQSGMPMSRSMTGILDAYMEFPGRLMRCRSPLGVWREQALFAGRLFDLMERSFHPESSRRQ
jgi:hypothetical protein